MISRLAICFTLFISVFSVTGAAQWKNVGPSSGRIMSMLACSYDCEQFFAGFDVEGVYRSDDSGKNCSIHKKGIEDYFFQSIAQHLDNPNILNVGYRSCVHKSHDGGRLWEWSRISPLNDNSYSAIISTVVHEPNNPRVVDTAVGKSSKEKIIGVGRWNNVGPGGGGRITSMLSSSHDSERLFAGCDVGGFYISDDGGQSYSIHNKGIEDYFVQSIVEHPCDPNTLYIGCRSGVYKSTDGGRSWEWKRNGFPPVNKYGFSAMVSKVVIDPLNPEVIYAAIGRLGKTRSGQGAIYRSMDGGENWKQIVLSGQLEEDMPIYDLAINANDSRFMLIASPNGVFLSEDGGETWVTANRGLPLHHRTLKLAQSPSDPNVVYVTLRGKAGETPWQAGVYRSDDGGRTWKVRTQGLSKRPGKSRTSDMQCTWTEHITVHPQNPNIVYTGGATWWDETVYKTVDGGLHWKRIFKFGKSGNAKKGWITFWGPKITSLTISIKNPDILYICASGRIYRTSNGGKTWQQRYTRERTDGLISGSGLEVTCLHTIAPHPRIKGKVYFGFYDIGLLVSDDYGATFRRNMQGVPKVFSNSCMTIAFANDDNRVWAGFGSWHSNNGTICESLDGGLTWRTLKGLPDARPCDLLYNSDPLKSINKLVYVAEGKGVFSSDDNGLTWKPSNKGLPAKRIRCIAKDKARPGVYYAGATCTKEKPASIFISTDFCESWQLINAHKNQLGKLSDIAVNDGHVYITTRDSKVGKHFLKGGVFRYREASKEWLRVYSNRFCGALAVDPNAPDTVLVALNDHPYHDCSAGGGIIMSRDGGRNWQSLVDESLSNKRINSITLDPTEPNRAWLGTDGNAAFTGRIKDQRK